VTNHSQMMQSAVRAEDKATSHAPQDPSAFLIAGESLAGVVLRRLTKHDDRRGSFAEVYTADGPELFVPAQWSLVTSRPGTLRGMHLHRRHDESVLLLQGRVHIGMRDVRPGSPTEGRSALYAFSGGDHVLIAFPRGLVHGWLFSEPSVHLQAVSETYADYGADDNLGCHWSDPALGIPWPTTPTLVAERADAFPSLAMLVAQTLAVDPTFGYGPVSAIASSRPRLAAPLARAPRSA